LTGWAFPGQGSQRPGMGASIAECHDLVVKSRDVLGIDLSGLLDENANSNWQPSLLQPAIFVTSAALAGSLRRKGASPEAVVGHSLGEYAALVAAGSLTFEDGLRLVDLRGRSMAEAARKGSGGMAAVIGLDIQMIEEICDETPGVWVANLNTPTQTVISGKEKPLSRAAEQCLQAGAARVVRLDVPVPAHTPVMEPAAKEIEQALATVEVTPPTATFYSPVDAGAHSDPEEIKALLAKGIVSPVRFFETVHAMRTAGVERLLEVGPGRAIRSLVRQISPDIEVVSISTDEAVDAEVLSPAGQTA
jgi:[acyl-carrier-protein] S-malonyltransferase